MTLKTIEERREKSSDRRQKLMPISFPDRRLMERREMASSQKKKIVVLGFNKIYDNHKLAREIKKAIEDNDLTDYVYIEQSMDLLDFVKHGVVLAPGVVIDGKLKSAGRQPKKGEIKDWINVLSDDIKGPKK
jgi:hypothetical protein